MRKEFFAEYFKGLQDSICKKIEETDGQGRFKEDLWKRKEGGGGRSRVLTNGNILEKAGVNFSAVYGPLHPKMVTSLKLRSGILRFWRFYCDASAQSLGAYHSHECALF
jgi:coproporphyrinogen III oxidase